MEQGFFLNDFHISVKVNSFFLMCETLDNRILVKDVGPYIHRYII